MIGQTSYKPEVQLVQSWRLGGLLCDRDRPEDARAVIEGGRHNVVIDRTRHLGAR